MQQLKQDLSVFYKFHFDRTPVGVKFLFTQPEGMRQLDKNISLCEMIKEAQQRETPFYITEENEDCFGAIVLGMRDAPVFAESGQMGVKLEIFQDARANSRLYSDLPILKRGTVRFVAFANLKNLEFEPDLLIILATPSQAEIVLRAMSYSTGETWAPKTTGVLGCAWLYAYPFLTGKVNYTITGLAFGMKAKQVFPEGLVLLSIPYNWLPIIVQSLKEMKWVLPAYTEGREKYIEREKRIIKELTEESPS